MQLLECSWNEVNPIPNYIWTNNCRAKDRLTYFYWDYPSFFNLDLDVILGEKKKKDLEMARSTGQLISQASKAVKLDKYCDCNNNTLTINVNCKIL